MHYSNTAAVQVWKTLQKGECILRYWKVKALGSCMCAGDEDPSMREGGLQFNAQCLQAWALERRQLIARMVSLFRKSSKASAIC